MKTGYKTSPQQRYRIHQGNYALLKLTISADKESIQQIIARCTSHLNEELSLKSVFYVDDEKDLYYSNMQILLEFIFLKK